MDYVRVSWSVHVGYIAGGVRRLRHRLSRSTPAKCWQESREEYGRRLKRCCEEVNKECNVEGLCKGLPKRMKLLQDRDGDRLKK